MKIKKILSILMAAATISATPIFTAAVPQTPKKTQAKEQKEQSNNETMPVMCEYVAAMLAIDDVAKNIPPRTNIHPQSKKYYDDAYKKASLERLNKQGFDDAINARPKQNFEDPQCSNCYNEGYAKGKIVYAYNVGVEDGSTGNPNQRELFANDSQALQNYDRGRLRGINILASEDREKKTNRRHLLTDSDELNLYDKINKRITANNN